MLAAARASGRTLVGSKSVSIVDRSMKLSELRGDISPMPRTVMTTVSSVARRNGVAANLLYRWRRLMSEGGVTAVRSDEPVVGNSEVRKLEERVRELERLLGRKTMENEILVVADAIGHDDELGSAVACELDRAAGDVQRLRG